MYRRYIADNNREHEKRARDIYHALLQKYNVSQKYANEDLSHSEMAVMPLRDWRHVPDPAEDANAFVEAWREMQCQNHHRELGCVNSLCECVTPDGVFTHPAVYRCERCRYN